MNLEGKIELIKEAVIAIKNAILGKGITPTGNVSTYADAIDEITTVNNTSLTVTPSLTSQTIRPTGDYTGFDPVNVNAVTNDIDENIVATNIKTGVTILGVEGSVVELRGETKTVTENGTYTPSSDKNGITSITVNVDTSVKINSRTLNDGNMMPLFDVNENILPLNYSEIITNDFNFGQRYLNTKNITNINLSALEQVNQNQCFTYAFAGCTSLTSVDLSSLSKVSGTRVFTYAFEGCTNLTSVDLSSLSEVSGTQAFTYAFAGCTSLTSVDLSSLDSIGTDSGLSHIFNNCYYLTSVDLSSLRSIATTALSHAFNGCTSLTSVDLSSLSSAYDSSLSSAFNGCTSLTSVDLSSLSKINDNSVLKQAFRDCTSLTSISFPSLNSNSFGIIYTNQFNSMLYGVSNCTVHFPSNLQSVIGSWSDVQNGFGGTATVVLFDLPATT